MFKINDMDIVEPIQLTMERVENLASELKTQSGRVVSDIRGWTYADTTLSWGIIPEPQLQTILPLHKFTITFEDIDGIKTVNAIRRNFIGQKQRFTQNGKAFYANFGMVVMFPDVYGI